MIEATVNGEKRTLNETITVSEFLHELGIDERVVVVEYNGDILPRVQFAKQRIASQDRLEIVQMMAGG
jgi:thiamine biosynthesis protein ThiS